MSDLIMSVSQGKVPGGTSLRCEALFSAYWLVKGAAQFNGKSIRHGEGALLRSGQEASFEGAQGCEFVRFDLTEESAASDAIISAKISLPVQPERAACLLRLDQVNFPTGGVAFRHVHPGDGIRFLVSGKLRVIADTHEETAIPGHAWFENANSPVRAEASTDDTQTSFVRFMVLPSAYIGKPTIRILDEEEALLPRKQVTQRHFDELAYLSSG